MSLRLRRRHSDKPYLQCQICWKQFTDKKFLEQHFQTHSGENPYKCEMYPEGFSKSTFLETHNLTRYGGNSYKCQYCFKTFTNYHVVTHNVYGCYCTNQCTTCSMHFVNKYSLRRHVENYHNRATGSVKRSINIVLQHFSKDIH